MTWLVVRMKWIMLVAGLLTCTMIYAAIDPRAALTSTFGSTVEGPVAEIVVRNWGILITLIGAMLVYGAFQPAVRSLVVVVAGLSKFAFIALVLMHGGRFLEYQAGIAVAIDAVMVLVFILYLTAAPRARTTGS